VKYGVGITGVGRRGYDIAESILRQRHQTDLELRALHNRTVARARLAKERLVAQVGDPPDIPGFEVHETYAQLLDDPAVDVVMVCTPQYAHKEPTLAALRAGKKVSLDKPLAHNLKDSLEIHRGQLQSGQAILMSFTRRFERPWIDAFRLVNEEKAIGSARMILVRNVLPYHTYFHTWHRKLAWSGGALADKMSHIFDVFNWFASDTPLRLSAIGGQAVFVPDPAAPERCRACRRECPYRVADPEGTNTYVRDRPDAAPCIDDSRLAESEILKRHDTCVWYPGADINDHGLVSIEYRKGVKASLFWTLFGPDTDDQETMEVVGDRGRIVLTRHRGTIDVVTDHGSRHELLDERTEQSSPVLFGANDRFVRELDQFCKGAPPAVTTREGLLAARMVEAAHRSIARLGATVSMEEIPAGQ
jgi:predicted dehydrogenase